MPEQPAARTRHDAAARHRQTATRRLGVVGIDSSHFPEFTKRIRKLNEDGESTCRVTQYWTDGDHHMPAEHVEQWRADAEGMGVAACESLDQMLDNVEGVMVLSVDGNQHLEHARPALERGLPTYVDKPLTCDLAASRELMAIAERTGAPCYSASSLRFAEELERLDRDALGDLVALDAYGPGPLNDAMPRFLFYGVHAVEMIDAIWGPGVQRVRARIADDRDTLEVLYHDGRDGRIRLERRGASAFGATVHGTKGVTSFKVDFAPIYSRLVAGMTRFFEGEGAPVALRDIVENIATLDAAQRSLERDGAWVDLASID